MLYPTPTLADTDRRVLDEIDAMRHDLRYQVNSTPRKWTEGLRKYLTADAIAASNSIEGFKVATVDAMDLMAGERDVDVSDEDREETLAYERVMTYIQTLHDMKDFAYSKGQLNALHWMLQGHRHTVAKPAGQWRPGEVWINQPGAPHIRAYTAPHQDRVPQLMTELIDWLNSDAREPLLVRAAMAHLHLVSIHPWADGNGRMSRSLQTLMIAREGVLAPEFSSIEAWLGLPGNTWDYYKVLARRGSDYQPDQDVSGWIRFNLTAYHQQAQTVKARMGRTARVGMMLTDYVNKTGQDQRIITALHEVAMTGRVRRARYEQGEALSVQQAQRDLQKLVASDLLASAGKTRARIYTAGPAYPPEILQAANETIAWQDPYEPDGFSSWRV